MQSRRPRIAAALMVFLLALLHSSALAAAPPRAIPGEILVKFKKSSSRTARAAARAGVHASLKRDFGFIRVELHSVKGMTTDQAIESLRKNPNVEYAEPNYEIHAERIPNDPGFPDLYGLRNTGQTGGTAGADVKAAQAWDLFTGDPNLMVGVIDSGVDYNHPDLAANIWTNPGEIPDNDIDDDENGYVDDVHGYDFFNNDGDPFDDNGHGTHCSGTIAAVGNNNIGVVGVNWGAKIVAIKFLNASGSGSTEGAIASIQYAIQVGVRLTSNSWGGGPFSQALLDAINAAGAAGQLFIAASGNSGANTDLTPQYPSAYDTPYVISVAATDDSDNLAPFSNFGATSVDIGAPGVNILSTLPGASYGTLSGTSMAAPYVSGVAALAWGRFPAITNLQVKSLIFAAADAKASLAGRCVTGARLNAFMTIAEPDQVPPGAIMDLATVDPGSNTMGLTWTATGDDGSTGRASRYDLRYATAPITDLNWSTATPLAGPDPRVAGLAESFEATGLSFSTLYYFAIKAVDEFNNAGPLSNVATGTTLGIPDVDASPVSFSAELPSGGTATRTLTLRNVGAGTLDFILPTPEVVFSTQRVNPYEPYAKDQADTRVGAPVAESKGGPDPFGYRWSDSDETGGPSFSWADITGLVDPVPLTGDDGLSDPVDMGMSFPFYGSTFTSVRICTNGFLSFTDGSAPFNNQMLPNLGAPANLVSPMWDDLDFVTLPRAYAYNDGSRFIVTWNRVPHFQTGGPNTFQAIFYPTGEIRFQYKSLDLPRNSATVGIQNGTRSIGLTVAFNTFYLRDSLAIRIVPLPQWVTVTPTSGRILAGQTLPIDVRFNAINLAPGVYDATLHVSSNDPDESDLPLAAHLRVLAPEAVVSPVSLRAALATTLGPSALTRTKTLRLSNAGGSDLVWTAEALPGATPPAWLTVSPDSGTTAPGAHSDIAVRFHATGLPDGDRSGVVHIASDDPIHPTLSIGCNLHVGTAAAQLIMESLTRDNDGEWVKAYVEPGVGHDPRNIRTSSVLLQRAVPVGTNTSISYHDKDRDGLEEAKYKFGRLALAAVLPVGNDVPVEVIGEVEDTTWFSGTTTIRVLKPRMDETAGLNENNNSGGNGGAGNNGGAGSEPVFSAGTTHRFGWSDPQGYVADYYDVWFSSNGGSSWSLAGGHLTTRSFAWLVPATPPASALLEVAAMDSQGIMGSWISQIFDVVSSPTGVEDQSALPREYALRMRGANPLVAGRTRFELTLPKPGAVTVRVYDVTGRFIRELSRRSLPAGYHGLSWDAKDAAGRPVGSGIYFLRADAAGKRMDLRLAIVR